MVVFLIVSPEHFADPSPLSIVRTRPSAFLILFPAGRFSCAKTRIRFAPKVFLGALTSHWVRHVVRLHLIAAAVRPADPTIDRARFVSDLPITRTKQKKKSFSTRIVERQKKKLTEKKFSQQIPSQWMNVSTFKRPQLVDTQPRIDLHVREFYDMFVLYWFNFVPFFLHTYLTYHFLSGTLQ